ncbi:unnamed protein product, partial [Strongylus vulgaris]
RVPKEKFKAILTTLNSLTDYRIVWAYDGEPIQAKSHIYTSKWVPQVDVLYDNRTVLFFSHGGLKSVKEATCSSTPAIFMPVFAEQVRNGWLAKNKGYAEVFNKHTLTSENLQRTMKRVLDNKSFTIKAAHVTKLLNDKIVHPLFQGAHYINRLLRYRGRMPEYFYPRAIDSDYFSHLDLDVLIIPVVLIVMVSK